MILLVNQEFLDVHIRALRAKLDDDGSKYIKTIRGVGYRYVEEVK